MPPADFVNHASSGYNNEKSHLSPVPAVAAPPQYSSGPQNGPELAEAMYEYRPTDDSDLPLYRGSQILVIEKVNPDWWRGRDKASGREGVFPSSYVRVLDGASQFSSPSPDQYRAQSYNSAPMPYQAPTPQPYFPPAASPAPQPVAYQQPQQHQQQPQQPQQPQHQPQAQHQQQQQQQQQHHHSGMEQVGKKFGKKLGNAAIFGRFISFYSIFRDLKTNLGCCAGAGATIGSNIVNSIF